MLEIKGNLWDFHNMGFPVVITTNCEINNRGEAIMGRGIALEAKQKFPGLAKDLGKFIKFHFSDVHYFPEYNLFNFPTKFDWRKDSDINLIKMSVNNLSEIVTYKRRNDTTFVNFDRIYLVRPGCSNGHLNWEEVKPIISKYLDDSYIVVNK